MTDHDLMHIIHCIAISCLKHTPAATINRFLADSSYTATRARNSRIFYLPLTITTLLDTQQTVGEGVEDCVHAMPRFDDRANALQGPTSTTP